MSDNVATLMIAQWEIRAAANMLVSARGDVAEEHADEQIARAIAGGKAGEEVVWRAIASEIRDIRDENRAQA